MDKIVTNKFLSRRTIALGFVVLVIGYITSMGAYDDDHDHEPANGKAQAADEKLDMAPAFTLEAMDGSTVALESLKGRWVFINFWATWCPSCVEEMPDIEGLSKIMADRTFTVLAIHVARGSKENIKAFVKHNKITFTTLFDKDGKTVASFGVKYLPTSFFINPKGEVVAIADGIRDWDNPEMVAFLSDLMESAV